jgi:hypothetical protein
MNKQLYNEVLDNLNKLILDEDGNIGRLIGYCETDEDYYWIINKVKNEKFINIYSSCVGSLNYLQECVSIEEYEAIDKELSKKLIKVDDVLVQEYIKK